jgi:hypothetical protein
MRSRYWSNSKLADWIRGTAKPKAETGRGWDLWEAKAQENHPVRYWIVEEAFDAVQSFIWWPVDKLHDVKYYINNRWVTRTNSLTAHARDIKPGQWQDVGNRFLPCLFNELVDFVEIETAWSHVAWGNEEAIAKYNPPFYAAGWWRWRTWRCPQAGIDHLNWASSLRMDDEWTDKDSPDYGKPTRQAESAMEILALYRWWKEVYPSRPDPHEASGWSAYCEERRQKNGGSLLAGLDDNSDRETSKSILDRLTEIEQAHNAEDEAMLIRLIKIRESLWT